MTPTERYEHAVQARSLQPDPQQRQAVAALQDLYDRLLNPASTPSWWQRLSRRAPAPVPGLYLWGGVGRGKTFLVDLFFDALPFAEKSRVHFHRFMQQIHHELKQLPKSPDPLIIVGKRLAQRYRVLCLDEFHVHDIADAMLLGGLLKSLFDHGVTLVTTSNIPIRNLYLNGLQRERFLPAIELLATHTGEVELGGETDYRINLLEKIGTYHTPLTESVDSLLRRQFHELATEGGRFNTVIPINQREVIARAVADEVVWFDFAQLCETHRCAADYLEIAQRYRTVLLSNLRRIHDDNDGVAKRLIDMIDAFYDHNVNLIISAECQPGELYRGTRLAFAFERTVSRLLEMRSHRYLALPHRPQAAPTGQVGTASSSHSSSFPS
ncbi:MAG: cell division protein ZapE [Pseudomonadota bacterium]